MNMFKRRDSRVRSPSSSCRENVANTHHRVKPVGCMAGVFHLISRYQRRRQRFLTSGSKRQGEEGNDGISNNNNNNSLVVHNTENSREVTGKVIINCSESSKKLVDGDDYDEKGRRLMEALRKCDEDLRKIQRVLEEARAARSLMSPEYKEGDRGQPPAQRRPLTTACKKTSLNNNNCFGHAQALQHSHEWKKFMKITRDNVDEQNNILNVAKASLMINNGYHKNREEATLPSLILLLRWNYKVVKETVEETYLEMQYEQKREITKIGLELHEHIYMDLIEEIINVIELNEVSSYGNMHYVMMKKQMPQCRHLCKRSLRF